jgi:16S rRNA (cytosine967-C5)-methyltransferase
MIRLAQGDDVLAGLFDGGPHAPAPIDPAEPVAQGGVAPLWLERALADSGVVGAEALLDRAPLDVRVNALKAARADIDLPESGEPLVARHGLRFAPGTPVESWPAYEHGMIEVQDGGSQLTCEVVDARPGETVLDLCAGAGARLWLWPPPWVRGGWWPPMWTGQGCSV